MTTPADWANALRVVQIDGVSAPRFSAVIAPGAPGRVPTIFVHGIVDSLWRWLTVEEAGRHGLVLPDWRKPLPRFQPLPADPTRRLALPRLHEGASLLARCCQEGLPALAYSYHNRRLPLVHIDQAVAKLHATTAWALKFWRAPCVHLVGHSWGGLVCRQALLRDSPVMSAAAFQRVARSLITIATPHRGSRLAEVARPLVRAYAKVDALMDALGPRWPGLGGKAGKPFEYFREFVHNISQLTPDSAIVRESAIERLPPLPGGYFAVAGNVATYVCCAVPLMGRIQLPPALNLPELTNGQGDMAVAIDSALAIPDASAARTAIAPVNHFIDAFDRQVHEAVIRWIREAGD